MDNYENIKQVGEGTFGKVYKSIKKDSNVVVAIKKVPIDKESGFSFTTVREIKALKKLRSKYVIDLIDVIIENDRAMVVLEYMNFDLTGLISMNYNFTDKIIASLAYQLIDGVAFIHRKGMIHRDLKPSNILLDSSGRLKIADFGLARDASSNMTNRVCTLWYRAPELLLGDTTYTKKIDAWSVGCIILEIKNGGPVFKGRDEISQVKEIFTKLGSPGVSYPWDGLFDISKYKKTLSWSSIINEAFGKLYDGRMLELIRELLCLDKNKRLSIENALDLPIVKSGSNTLYPLEFKESHEFYTKEKKTE
jgi:serine/threonine protein kinase